MLPGILQYFLIRKAVLIKSVQLNQIKSMEKFNSPESFIFSNQKNHTTLFHYLSDPRWNNWTWYLKHLNALYFNVIQNQFNFLFLQKFTGWPILRAPKALTLFRGSQTLPEKLMQFLLRRHASCLLVQEAHDRHNTPSILGEITWPKILV